MSEKTCMETAVNAAREAYGALLEEVVERHVLKDREDVPLGKETRQKLEKGQMAHPNVVRLLTISGKGGFSSGSDGEENPYARFYNVTLLDHLLSTARGAVVFAAFEWLNQNPDMDKIILMRRLRVIAAIAFLHDLDKDLQLPRNSPLADEMVKERMDRYGLAPFLTAVDVRATAGPNALPDRKGGSFSSAPAPDPKYCRCGSSNPSLFSYAWLTSWTASGAWTIQ